MKKKKLLFWSIIIIAFGTLFIRQQVTIYKLKNEYQGYNEQLKKLQAQNTELNQQLKLTQRDDYIEKLAREKLGLIKPGEVLIVDKNRKK
jgi:cell division protein FtsL